jgi:hypothetical protein
MADAPVDDEILARDGAVALLKETVLKGVILNPDREAFVIEEAKKFVGSCCACGKRHSLALRVCALWR